jgi:DHA1 family multidrug resistance protein-like MFS transporter
VAPNDAQPDEPGSARSTRNLVAVTAASFIGFMSFTLVMPFLPLYFRELGVSDSDIGEIAFWTGISLGVTPALTALLAPVWGAVADRLGRKIMVERSLLSFVVAMAATAYVWRPWHVFALRAVQGLFAGYGALTLTMAIESAPKARVAQAIGIVQTAQRIGPAIGPVLGGAVAQLVGLRRAFLVASSLYLAAFLLVLVCYKEPRREPAAAAQNGRSQVAFRNSMAFRSFVLLMGVLFGFQFVDRSLSPVLPIFVGELGTPLERIPIVSGILFSIMAGAAAAGHHVSGRLLKRRSTRAVMAGGAVLATVAVSLMAIATGVNTLFFVIALFGTAMGIAITAAYTAGAALIPAGAQATGFGFLTSASLVGYALSPMVAGVLGAVSIRAVFVLDGAVLLLVGCLVARVLGEVPARAEAPQVEDA